ncbi:MAG: methyltransferase domain-containing protein [Nitrospiria bacterium]
MNLEKLEAKKQWNRNPCGSGKYLLKLQEGSLDYFDEVRRSRYEDSDSWMKRTIDFSVGKGKRLLEIGFGMGSDLLTFCEEGAEVYGIDITEKHFQMAKENFELHGRKCNLKLCDAANIDYPSNYFDMVYSLGVLHHTPDTVRCMSEAYRVLKPGGLFILGLYNTFSAYHIFTKILFEGIALNKLKKLGYRGLMATVEYGADGVNFKPLVKTYSRKELSYMLADFSNVKFKVAHFKRKHIPILGKFLPKRVENWLEPYLGWYVIAFAIK